MEFTIFAICFIKPKAPSKAASCMCTLDFLFLRHVFCCKEQTSTNNDIAMCCLCLEAPLDTMHRWFSGKNAHCTHATWVAWFQFLIDRIRFFNIFILFFRLSYCVK